MTEAFYCTRHRYCFGISRRVALHSMKENRKPCPLIACVVQIVRVSRDECLADVLDNHVKLLC